MAAKATSLPKERPRPEDDPSEEARDRTQGRASLPAGLDRVQVAARGSRHTRFTALLHHVDEAALFFYEDYGLDGMVRCFFVPALF